MPTHYVHKPHTGNMYESNVWLSPDRDLVNRENYNWRKRIVKIAAKEDDTEDDNGIVSFNTSKVSSSGAVNALNIVLKWAEG